MFYQYFQVQKMLLSVINNQVNNKSIDSQSFVKKQKSLIQTQNLLTECNQIQRQMLKFKILLYSLKMMNQINLSLSTLVLSLVIICFSYLIYVKVIKPYRSYKLLSKMVASKYKATIDPFYFLMPPLYEKILRDSQRYGDAFYSTKLNQQKHQVYVTLFGSTQAIFLCDSSLVKDFYQKNNQGYYEKSKVIPFVRSLKFIMGNGLAFSQGDDWKKKRKIMSSVFNHEFIKSKIPYISKITKEILDRVEQLPQNKGKNEIKVQLNQTLQEIFGNIVIKAFFGDIHLLEIRGKSVFAFFNEMFVLNQKRTITLYAALLGPQFLTLNLRPIDREVSGMNRDFSDYAQNVIRSQIESLRITLENEDTPQEDKEKSGITQLLIRQQKLKSQEYQSQPQTNDFYTPMELVEEFRTFLTGGTETTSNTTTVLLYQLAKNKNLQQRVREQIQSVIGDDLENINYEKLKDLKELEKCLKETLRMFSPAPDTIMRQAMKDHYIGQMPVKQGTNVAVSIFSGHYKQEFHKNPFSFNPDRWDSIDPNKTDQYSFLPFSLGQRSCIGQQLAYIQAKIAVVHILKRYKEIRLQKPQYRLLVITSYGPERQQTTLVK